MCAGLVRWRASGGGGAWTSAEAAAQHIDHGWLTDAGRELESNARCVVVVEKDGVFQRLVEDRFFSRAHRDPREDHTTGCSTRRSIRGGGRGKASAAMVGRPNGHRTGTRASS
mmetsp:Transcript_9798/g.29399  ORF Transcript_9798/g.29399 Transcript_9798/m.29399 type:complete len:113 (-) Transcript_9798:611-949(-)